MVITSLFDILDCLKNTLPNSRLFTISSYSLQNSSIIQNNSVILSSENIGNSLNKCLIFRTLRYLFIAYFPNYLSFFLVELRFRDIPNYPKEGILFKDLSTLLLKPELTSNIVDDIIANLPTKPDAIVAIESRGFWFGPLIANKLQVPFIPLRKKGKLPGEVESVSYDLEYGSAVIEIHKRHLQKDWNVMIHDDLLATGGTAIAAAELVKRQGAKVHSNTFVVNLDFLGGRKLIDKEGIFFYSSVNF